MKNKAILGVIIIFLCITTAYADKELSLDEKIKEMKRNLELTDEQTRKIRPIMQEYKDEVDHAKQNKEDKLKTVLTLQQMNILKKLDEENLQGGLPK